MRTFKLRARLYSILSISLKKAERLLYRYLHPDAIACVPLRPKGVARGYVLMAHVVEPFLVKPGSSIPTTHTHFGEALAKAQSLLELGFGVDVISYRNTVFRPRRQYDLLVSSRVNFERLANLVGQDCIKILDLDIAHWLFNNTAASRRLLDLQERKKKTLNSYRRVEEVWAIESADYVLMKGSLFTYGTYRYADKPIFQMPNPAIKTYSWPETKDFDLCRNTFLWLGSQGPVHKGLDLVLEAFAAMPDCRLVVFGPVAQDKRFAELYSEQLFHTPNIDFRGWVDVASTVFEDAAQACIGVVYPSASEGCAGSVITCLHAGLLPIVSYESGVEFPEGCGVVLKQNTIEEIQAQVRAIAALPADELQLMSRRTWEFARSRHTQSEYQKSFGRAIDRILADQSARSLSGFLRIDS